MTAETYQGGPCKHGHTLRYKRNRNCVQCAKTDSFQWAKNHREKVRESNNRRKRFRTTGWTSIDYQLTFDIQNGICAIEGCNNQAIAADHNHTTGQLRGLLCHRCNIHLIATLENYSPEMIASGYRYLEKWK
jgi:hypothetical protein